MDWATVSALATAGGTLVLAVATFASVRSANRSARTAERALLAGMRPLLFPSRLQDPVQKITWADAHVSRLPGGQGTAELMSDSLYLTMSLRNVGPGIAVLQGWDIHTDIQERGAPPRAPEDFRRQMRDIYIAPNDMGFWQGSFRDRSEVLFAPLESVVEQRRPFIVDLLYTNAEGGQRMISRFSLAPAGDDGWMCTVGRHFSLDHDLAR